MMIYEFIINNGWNLLVSDSSHTPLKISNLAQCFALYIWHSSFNPNLYVDYENMIRFAEKVWILEGWLDTDRNIRIIGQLLSLWYKLFQQNES